MKPFVASVFVSDLSRNRTHLAPFAYVLLTQPSLGHSTREIMDRECSTCSLRATCEGTGLHLLNMVLEEECQILHQHVAEV